MTRVLRGAPQREQLLDPVALYEHYFEVKPAHTPALLAAAYALRYQVYCREHAFENPGEHDGEQETDPYDAHSVHAVLCSRRTAAVVGCVRLILPGPTPAQTLPIRRLLGAQEQARLDTIPRETTAEISRYAVSKAFRRRVGEDLHPDVGFELDAAEARRLAPHMTLGLFRGVATLANAQGVTHVCAVMAPSLLRLLERCGLKFEHLGPVLDYHGRRQPCMAELEQLRAGLANARADYARFVDAAWSAR